MKKTKAAPIAMYPTKNKKKVSSCNGSPSYFWAGSTMSAALTVPAIARAIVATNSRLVVLEKRSNDMFLRAIPS
jgi:hypothetical protein